MWSDNLTGVACEVCHNAYLIPADAPTQLCPNCFRDQLDTAPEAPLTESELNATPERVVPFVLSEKDAVDLVAVFAGTIPFPPEGLTPEAIAKRMRRVYLPVWLVDGDVSAQWKADLGEYYEVVSHKESYSGGQWHTQEVKETRTRWEPHLGDLTRHYDNVPAPAVEGYLTLVDRLQRWDITRSEPFEPQMVQGTFLQLPTRPQADAWTEAQTMFLRRAEDEVHKAAGSDEIRDFKWKPEFISQNWTQLYVPLYTTYYEDDDGNKRVIFVNGQTGGLYGAMQASLKSARPRILLSIIFGIIVFGLGLLAAVAGLFIDSALFIGALGMLAGIGIGLTAIGPVVRVSQFNTRHDARQPWLKVRTE